MKSNERKKYLKYLNRALWLYGCGGFTLAVIGITTYLYFLDLGGLSAFVLISSLVGSFVSLLRFVQTLSWREKIEKEDVLSQQSGDLQQKENPSISNFQAFRQLIFHPTEEDKNDLFSNMCRLVFIAMCILWAGSFVFMIIWNILWLLGQAPNPWNF